jgi:hypothetical protein
MINDIYCIVVWEDQTKPGMRTEGLFRGQLATGSSPTTIVRSTI